MWRTIAALRWATTHEAMETITVREIRPEDVAAADAVLVGAFGPPGSYAAELRRYVALDPHGWLLAELDGRAVGTAGALCYGPFAHIGLVAVRPDAQRRGVGAALMERLLAGLEARGCASAVLDATEAGAGLYARFGFVEVERTVRYVRQEGDAERPPASRAVTPLLPADLPEVAAFDAPIFGADRTAVLASYLRDAAGRAFLTRDERGEIAGYLIAQPAAIGPWAARSAEDAEALLGAALASGFGGGVKAIVPGANRAAPHVLMRYGFRPQRSLRRMLRGRPIAAQRELLYGQASLAIG